MSPETTTSLLAALDARFDAFVASYEKVCRLQGQVEEEREKRYTESQSQRDQALVLALENKKNEAVREARALALTQTDLAELKTWMYTTIGQVKGRATLLAGTAAGLSMVSTALLIIHSIGG